MTKPIARDPIYRQRAFEMSSPYQLSSTHPVVATRRARLSRFVPRTLRRFVSLSEQLLIHAPRFAR